MAKVTQVQNSTNMHQIYFLQDYLIKKNNSQRHIPDGRSKVNILPMLRVNQFSRNIYLTKKLKKNRKQFYTTKIGIKLTERQTTEIMKSKRTKKMTTYEQTNKLNSRQTKAGQHVPNFLIAI